ncbi:MAG TPA: NAD(P)-dependent oxidoreductase [Steroidobacteraceae bacterium]|nr:NAD(P)-dependent oxidoreductase [Steroidobacteraceae bacterium]
MKAVLQYRASAGFRQSLARMCPSWLEVSVVNDANPDSLARAIRDAEVLLHVLEPVTAAVIAAAPRLRLIQKIGVGVNTIDLAAAAARGIAVANMPGINSQAVAEFTLGLMLALLRHIPLLDRRTRGGEGWSTDPETFDRAGEIQGRVVGFMGFGQVPRRLAPVIEALGGSVIHANRTLIECGGHRQVPFEELLAQSDILSLHVPLAPDTVRIIDARALARMKRGAMLINTARGELIDEGALYMALRSGQLAGAALDVLATEPAPAGHPLFTLSNVLVTPHIAWQTPETLRRSLEVAIRNCQNIRAGSPLLNRIV